MQHTSLMSLDACFVHEVHAMTFPFICQLSLAPLIAFWQQAISTQHPIKAAIASMVQDKLRQAPELLEPITDQAILARCSPSICRASMPPRHLNASVWRMMTGRYADA
jgi:hypothetical protein